MPACRQMAPSCRLLELPAAVQGVIVAQLGVLGLGQLGVLGLGPSLPFDDAGGRGLLSLRSASKQAASFGASACHPAVLAAVLLISRAMLCSQWLTWSRSCSRRGACRSLQATLPTHGIP